VAFRSPHLLVHERDVTKIDHAVLEAVVGLDMPACSAPQLVHEYLHRAVRAVQPRGFASPGVHGVLDGRGAHLAFPRGGDAVSAFGVGGVRAAPGAGRQHAMGCVGDSVHLGFGGLVHAPRGEGHEDSGRCPGFLLGARAWDDRLVVLVGQELVVAVGQGFTGLYHRAKVCALVDVDSLARLAA
jgi:hypothetical protein